MPSDMMLAVTLVACAPIAAIEPADPPTVAPADPPTVASAAPPTVPATWPIPLFDEPETTVADLNGDGVADTRVESRSIGSGWHGFADCLRDGATGHVACDQSQDTPYSQFSGFKRTLSPPVGNRAQVAEQPCTRWKAGDPRWGALDAVTLQTPRTGTSTPPLRWASGPVRVQEGACLTEAEAAAFPGAQTWSAASTDGTWTVYWSPRGAVTWQPSANEELHRVATAGSLEVWQQGHALAVYDATKDRHAWIASWAELNDGFKVDRWERIASVVGAPGEVRVKVASLEGTETVRVKLAP